MEWSGPRLAHFQLQNNKRFHPKSQTSTMAVGIDVRRWHGRQRTTGGRGRLSNRPSRIKALFFAAVLWQRDGFGHQWLAQMFLVFAWQSGPKIRVKKNRASRCFIDEHGQNVAEWATAV